VLIALRNLMRRKLRSLFALIQLAVAIAAFVAIVGVVNGLRRQFYRLGEVFAYDLVIQAEGAASPVFSTVTRKDAERIAEVPGVESVSLLRLHFMLAPNLSQPVGFLGMDPGSELMSRYKVYRGRELTADDTTHILVGESMARDLGVDISALVAGGINGAPPEVEMIGGIKFQIVGVFRSPLTDVPFLSGQAILNLGWLLEIGKNQPMMAFAHRRPGHLVTDPDEVKPALLETAKLGPLIKEALPRLKAGTIDSFLDSFKQTELIDQFATAILFLAALLSGIGIANTMLMSVFDRTREIGLLRAVGWSRWRIVAMIETEGMLLALGGGILGAPLGYLMVQASKQIIKMGWLSVEIDPLLYLQAVGIAALIGIFGSLYPALRASRLQPTEALRHE
jgi:putative ABC transport system permease protein